MWKVFLGLDSDRFPLRTYGDVFFRVYGQIPHHIVNFRLGIRMMLLVSVLIIANGQSISQISQRNHSSNGNGICFVACLMIFMAAGFILGQIRTLQRFGWISNFAVCSNLVIIFLCTGVVAHSPPNLKATKASYGDAFGPGLIKTFAGTPPSGYASAATGLIGSLNGLDQIVYSYGGCMVFVSFLAEMRQPMDFWKTLLCGELFIYCVYLLFGIFAY
ncbi:Fc.00g080640.m01.CDS01 [Cosmosporella sp. VM-42]